MFRVAAFWIGFCFSLVLAVCAFYAAARGVANVLLPELTARAIVDLTTILFATGWLVLGVLAAELWLRSFVHEVRSEAKQASVIATVLAVLVSAATSRAAVSTASAEDEEDDDNDDDLSEDELDELYAQRQLSREQLEEETDVIDSVSRVERQLEEAPLCPSEKRPGGKTCGSCGQDGVVESRKSNAPGAVAEGVGLSQAE